MWPPTNIQLKVFMWMLDEDDLQTISQEIEEQVKNVFYREVKLKPIPDFCDVLSIEEFVTACREGLLTDDDGVGVYATNEAETNIEIIPSLVMQGEYNYVYPNVCWYNK